MNAVEMISLYGTLFYVSLAIAVVGLALAAFFFFYFDIPTVYALMTGKAKEDTIRRMAEQNAKTGNLRNQYIHTGPTGKTENTGALSRNVPQPGVQEQTAPLAQPERDETSVLQTPAQETTILSQAAPETQVLRYDGADSGETSLLNGSGAYAPQPAAYQQVPAGFRFDVTESTLVIHTNETIS